MLNIPPRKQFLAVFVAVATLATVAQPASGAERTSAIALSLPTEGVGDDGRGPAPTEQQIEEIHEYLGPEAVEELQKTQGSDGLRAAPIAGVVIAAAAWCAAGALSSLPDSAIQDVINRGEGGGNYVQNAIIGCITGQIGKAAWRLIPMSVKQRVYSAIVRFWFDHIRKK